MNRDQYAEQIIARITPLAADLRGEFLQPGRISSFAVDNLLRDDLALEIFKVFPKRAEMTYKKTIRERKAVSAQMNLFHPILQEILYAFHAPQVVALISQITGIQNLIPDHRLYAGGISRMDKGDFLQPHLDNSHDMDRKNYRVLNLLYYVTPDWKIENGGNLELWDMGPEAPPRTILSAFNRLVVMATDKHSWHSVNPIQSESPRTCISNYYFAPAPLSGHHYFHVTSFRGRPEQTFLDLVLRADSTLRRLIRTGFKKGLIPTKHFYRPS